MKTPAEIQEAIRTQRELCGRNRWPHFAPYDGVCWACHQQIYEVEDGKSYVTGCPHCHRSYCD